MRRLESGDTVWLRVPGCDTDSDDDCDEATKEWELGDMSRVEPVLDVLASRWLEAPLVPFAPVKVPKAAGGKDPPSKGPGRSIGDRLRQRAGAFQGGSSIFTAFRTGQAPTYRLEHVAAPIVRETCVANGMVATQDQDFCIMWSGPSLKDFAFKDLHELQRVNHFPGGFELTRKDNMFEHLSEMARDFGDEIFDFIPETFVLPDQAQAFLERYRTAGGIWIVKPSNAACGRGIFLFRNLAKSSLNVMESAVVSRYIHNPLLIQGLKFDLRIYVLVTQYEPLRAYIYREGLARFASTSYSTDEAGLSDVYRHLTNYSINKHSPNFCENTEVEQDNHGHKWSLSAFNRHVKWVGGDPKLVWHRIMDLCVKTLLAVEPLIANRTRKTVDNPGVCFELYGFDVLVDDCLKPWILEVNLSPSMMAESPLDWQIKSSLLSDAFNLVGVSNPDLRTVRAAKVRNQVAQARAAHRKMLLERGSFTGLTPDSPTQSAKGKSDMPRPRGGRKQGKPMIDDKPLILEMLTESHLRMLARSFQEFRRCGNNFIRLYPTRSAVERYAPITMARANGIKGPAHILATALFGPAPLISERHKLLVKKEAPVATNRQEQEGNSPQAQAQSQAQALRPPPRVGGKAGAGGGGGAAGSLPARPATSASIVPPVGKLAESQQSPEQPQQQVHPQQQDRQREKDELSPIGRAQKEAQGIASSEPSPLARARRAEATEDGSSPVSRRRNEDQQASPGDSPKMSPTASNGSAVSIGCTFHFELPEKVVEESKEDTSPTEAGETCSTMATSSATTSSLASLMERSISQVRSECERAVAAVELTPEQERQRALKLADIVQPGECWRMLLMEYLSRVKTACEELSSKDRARLAQCAAFARLSQFSRRLSQLRLATISDSDSEDSDWDTGHLADEISALCSSTTRALARQPWSWTYANGEDTSSVPSSSGTSRLPPPAAAAIRGGGGGGGGGGAAAAGGGGSSAVEASAAALSTLSTTLSTTLGTSPMKPMDSKKSTRSRRCMSKESNSQVAARQLLESRHRLYILDLERLLRSDRLAAEFPPLRELFQPMPLLDDDSSKKGYYSPLQDLARSRSSLRGRSMKSRPSIEEEASPTGSNAASASTAAAAAAGHSGQPGQPAQPAQPLVEAPRLPGRQAPQLSRSGASAPTLPMLGGNRQSQLLQQQQQHQKANASLKQRFLPSFSVSPLESPENKSRRFGFQQGPGEASLLEESEVFGAGRRPSLGSLSGLPNTASRGWDLL